MKLRLLTASTLLATACGLAACGGGSVGSPDTKALNVPAKQELLQEGPLGDRVIGKASAPVTIIEYASLTCPHCRAYHRDVFPRVKRELIDTGKVRYIIREFPIGRTAGTAAIVTRCAPAEKNLYYTEQFLARQPEWVSQDVREDAIFQVAKTGGMSRETFDKCLSNQTIIDGLNEVKQRGRKFGVIGTPTLFINGQKAQGTVTFEQIKTMLAPQAS